MIDHIELNTKILVDEEFIEFNSVEHEWLQHLKVLTNGKK